MAYRKYPHATVAPGDITGASVSGLTVLTDTAAAGRAALGIADLTSFEMDALAFANSVCGFTRAPLVWRASMADKPGVNSSPWLTATVTGTGAQALVLTAPDSNSVRSFTSGATAASAMQLHSTLDGSFVKPLMAELRGTKWLLASDFKMLTVPDAQAEAGVGWNRTDLASGRPMIGMRGGLSTTKFACYLMDSNTGVASTVNLDTTAWHTGYQWGNGHATEIYASFDHETKLTLGSMSLTGVCGPFVNVRNFTTAAAQTMELRQTVIIYESVA